MQICFATFVCMQWKKNTFHFLFTSDQQNALFCNCGRCRAFLRASPLCSLPLFTLASWSRSLFARLKRWEQLYVMRMTKKILLLLMKWARGQSFIKCGTAFILLFPTLHKNKDPVGDCDLGIIAESILRIITVWTAKHFSRTHIPPWILCLLLASVRG